MNGRAGRLGALVLLACISACATEQAPAGGDERPDPEIVAAGLKIYLSNGCANCHGEDGSGRGAIAVGFATPPRDYRNPDEYRFGTDAAAIAETIARGIPNPGSSMPSFRHLGAASRDALAAYIVSLQHPDALDIAIGDAWIAESIPGTEATAGYMEFRNDGAGDVIVAVEADFAGSAAIHLTIHEDDMMRMTRLPNFDLPASGTASLEPGAAHLMLEELVEPLREGQAVEVTFFLASRRAIRATVPVRRREGVR